MFKSMYLVLVPTGHLAKDTLFQPLTSKKRFIKGGKKVWIVASCGRWRWIPEVYRAALHCSSQSKLINHFEAQPRNIQSYRVVRHDCSAMIAVSPRRLKAFAVPAQITSGLAERMAWHDRWMAGLGAGNSCPRKARRPRKPIIS